MKAHGVDTKNLSGPDEYEEYSQTDSDLEEEEEEEEEDNLEEKKEENNEN